MNLNEALISFEQLNLMNSLTSLNQQGLDELAFGVIRFNKEYIVVEYNRFETEATGLTRDYVVGKHVFNQIAQCMNNYMVAQQFEDAWATSSNLDTTIDYVLTWRMKPTKVMLRLLREENCDFAYIILSPRSALNI
jgi:photoactive yellow protein